MATTENELAQQQVEYLYQQSVGEIIAGCTVAVIITGVAWAILTPGFAICWLIGALAVYAVRYSVTRRQQRASVHQTGRLLSVFLAGTGATGAAWGVLGIALSIPALDLGTAFGLFWIVCMAASMVAVYAGLYGAVLSFALPALLPAAVTLIIGGSRIGTFAGLLLCAVTALLPLAAMRIRGLLIARLSLERTLENLTAEHSASCGEVARLQMALKSNANRREQAEATLMQTSTDLKSIKHKADLLEKTVERVSPLCPVTLLANRKTFDDTHKSEWRRALRTKHAVSLLLLDIDNLAAHKDSDAVLKRLAKLLKGFGRRAGDMPAHLGNGRFAVVLPGSDQRDTARMAEALRRRVEFDEIPSQASHHRLSVSIGTATMVPLADSSESELEERAQLALQDAQEQGGNVAIAYRSVGYLRVDRWNKRDDGPLNEENLLQKLYVLGFKGDREINTPGVNLADQAFDAEAVKALLSGQLRLVVDGEEVVLKEGDCLFIPPGTTYSTEVVGQQPVVNYQGKRS